ncbi:GNAT family N-acetyltransferase [Streptomyces sp. NPDC001700]
MLIRRETPSDIAGVRDVTAAAFGKSEAAVPVEVTLLGELRTCDAWLPALSFVAAGDRGDVIGHVVCTRGHVGPDLALGLGPLSVHPAHQRRGVGLALMHAILGAADAFGESLVALLGSPAYYGRFGFRPASAYGITAPDPAWGDYFQVRPLTAYQPTLKGPFAYAEPFDRV